MNKAYPVLAKMDDDEWVDPCEVECGMVLDDNDCDDCVDAAMADDWCEPMWNHDMDMTDEDWEAVMGCYEDLVAPCDDLCSWDPCSDCWDAVMEAEGWEMDGTDATMNMDATTVFAKQRNLFKSLKKNGK